MELGRREWILSIPAGGLARAISSAIVDTLVVELCALEVGDGLGVHGGVGTLPVHRADAGEVEGVLWESQQLLEVWRGDDAYFSLQLTRSLDRLTVRRRGC